MYPDLSYFFHDVIGTDYDNFFAIFKTFGMFLALSFAAAGYVVYLELKRRQKPGGSLEKIFSEREILQGEKADWKPALSGGILGFLLGFKVLHIYNNFEAFKTDPVKILLSFDGNLVAGIIGAVLMGGYYYWDKKRQELPKPIKVKEITRPSDRVFDILVVAAVTGILGAKIFALFENLSEIGSAKELLDQLVSGSGLAVMGGLIGGAIGVLIYIRRVGIPPIEMMDAAGPAIMVAIGIGRLGCHFSGDGDWGIVAAAQPDWWFMPDWLWAYDYPRNVSEGYHAGKFFGEEVDCGGCKYHWKLMQKVYPTSVYEFFMASGFFGILWALRKKLTVPGMLFFVFMIFYAIHRWSIEKIRVNDKFMWDMTQAEVLSVAFFIIGILGVGYLFLRKK